jgi:glutathionyl-hydroquinone reductase
MTRQNNPIGADVQSLSVYRSSWLVTAQSGTLRRIVDYPNLWNYLRALYHRPEFKVTCNLDQIKRGYYRD